MKKNMSKTEFLKEFKSFVAESKKKIKEKGIIRKPYFIELHTETTDYASEGSITQLAEEAYEQYKDGATWISLQGAYPISIVSRFGEGNYHLVFLFDAEIGDSGRWSVKRNITLQEF